MNGEKDIIEKWRDKLHGLSGVVAVGRGYKVTAGRPTETMSIICSVIKKLPLSELRKKDVIPPVIDGIRTDVFESGVIRAMKERTSRWRPAPGGVSIGHPEITAGTLGCLVKKDGNIHILSNNHVLANSNNAEIGNQALQPASYDKGQLTQDMIGRLAEFVPIEFEELPGGCDIGNFFSRAINIPLRIAGRKTRIKSFSLNNKNNYVDAAIARPIYDADVEKNILEIGVPVGVSEAILGMPIQKSGRTTGLTKGEITQTDVSVQVQYGNGKIAMFIDQLMAGNMCSGGDSGSAVLDLNNYLIGLLFAGSDTSTVINRIQRVFSSMNLILA